MMRPLSDISKKLSAQPMFTVLDKVQKMERAGHKIIHFELGDPDFDTPKNIVESAKLALDNGATHYTSSMGLYEFREVVQQTTIKSRGFEPDINQILVAPGANSIIYLAIRCLVNPGDEVIIPNPGFPTYFSAIDACDAVAVSVPVREENDFCWHPKEVEASITDKTKLIILNSPSNPTGGTMDKETIKEIARIAEKHGIYLLSDEVYSRLIFDRESHFFSPSSLDKCKQYTIVLNGFSKTFAMTGWRLGAAIGPACVIEKMSMLVSTIASCVPPFIQYAGIEAIIGNQNSIQMMKNSYQERIEYLVNGLNAIDGISCVMPKGAIYAFANIKKTGMSSDEFTDFCLEKAHVAVLPGNNFGEYGEGYVRFSCVTSLEQIKEALIKIENALKEK